MKYISFSKKKTCKTKVEIRKGHGLLTINNLSIKKYFGNIYNKNYILLPIILSSLKNFDFIIKTKGSGKISQIFSIKIAICKCILLFNYKFKKIFRKLNFFSIDNRIVERKKYGKKKSRKSEQYSKR
ncbi:30S ribosomal protein S9 [Candidatus Carsonella ruddii]|uniref:Small ribosomal subunit protein uS9 n=1 Tax=Candidatus Carsonella ruddii (Diaphorina cf. continua) TaxID=2661587 RepID=A0A7R6VYF2_CARRU|nr:30S ribosomal protein S9 [Candidatus Carsonella ruddii (Diaphorina cf. continua)]BCG49274.1 30S ribosomal protein S9 [Candidatus Carsonella ruddii (Diaphorina cf. continua)]